MVKRSNKTENNTQVRSTKWSHLILSSQVKRPACPLKFTEETAGKLSRLLRISWRVDLPDLHPRGSSSFLSHWVLSNTNAAQPLELHSAEHKWGSSDSSQVACRLVSPTAGSSEKNGAQCIQLGQENEETLGSSLVRGSGSIRSSRKGTVYYTGLVCSLAHACEESKRDFCY